MPNINYIEIFKRAWNITWRNRYLWWFGLFIALSGSGGSFNYSPNEEEKSKIEGFVHTNFQNFVSTYWNWILVGIIVLFILLVIFIVLGLIGRGALIKSADKAIQEKQANFKEGFREGKKYLGKTFLIGFILGFFLLISIVILIVPIVILFSSKAYVFGTLLTIIGILTIIPVIIIISFLKTYGYIYAILGELKVWAAIESAYALFRRNIASSIIMGLIFVPLNLTIGIGIFLIIFSLAIIFFLIGLGLYAVLGKIGIAITVGMAIFLLIMIMLLIKSAYEVFSQIAWILFFRQIATPKIEEKITEPITEEAKEELPEAEVIKTAGGKK